MELHRLIVERADGPITLDLHPRLTVAWHEDAAVRGRLVDDLIGSLGAGRDGVHAELTLGSGQSLVLFRAVGVPHRAIDADRAVDVTPAFRGAPGTVDLLSRLGLPPPADRRALRLDADQLTAAERAGPGGAPPVVAELAALDQTLLWGTAERLVAAEARLDAAVGHGPSGDGADRAAALDWARSRQLADHAQRRVAVAARAHRGVLVRGGIVAGACAAVALLLLAFDGVLDDDGWTSKVLLLLAGAAVAVAVWDRRGLQDARREERELLRTLGLASARSPAGGSGAGRELTAAAAEDTSRELLAAAAAYEPLAERWKLVSGGAPLEVALAHRSEIERLAARQEAPSPGERPGPGPAGAAELLRTRVAALARVGVVGERLPLVLDEPFTGFDPADAERLLGEVERLSAHHQVVLVSGAADVLAWASPRAACGRLALARLDVAAVATEAQPAPA